MIRYIFLSAVFYMAFLLITLPANVVYGYWKEYLAGNIPVTLTGLEGSVWSGHASSATLMKHKLQGLDWSLSPLSLLLGKLELDWEFSVPDGNAQGSGGISLFGEYFLKAVDAQLPATVIASYANAGALSPDGTVTIAMQEIATDGKSITRANGTIAWKGAAVTLFKPMELGNYEVALSQEGDTIIGLLKDTGGPLAADGKLTLTPEGDYQYDGSFSVRETGRQDLRQAMQTLGQPDREGKIKITRKGNISQLGLGG